MVKNACAESLVKKHTICIISPLSGSILSISQTKISFHIIAPFSYTSSVALLFR